MSAASAAEVAFACPACRRPLRVPGSFAGRSGRCPRCRETVAVPAESEPDLLSPVAPPEPVGLPAPGLVPPLRQPCPACGEAILTGALKCRFCGEVFGRLPREQLAQPGRPPQPLASPGERLGAYLLDRALYLPAFFLAGLSTTLLDQRVVPSQRHAFLAAGLGIAGGAWALLVFVQQTHLLTRDGATLGKGWLGLRVVNPEGRIPGFSAAVLRRSWLAVGIYLTASALSALACLLWLLDKTLVLAGDRRSLRDHLAGTFVVRVPRSEA